MSRPLFPYVLEHMSCKIILLLPLAIILGTIAGIGAIIFDIYEYEFKRKIRRRKK